MNHSHARTVVEEWTAAALPAPRMELGESPRWDARHNLLALVDIRGCRVVFVRGERIESVDVPGRAGMIAPRAAAGWCRWRAGCVLRCDPATEDVIGRVRVFHVRAGVAGQAEHAWKGAL